MLIELRGRHCRSSQVSETALIRVQIPHNVALIAGGGSLSFRCVSAGYKLFVFFKSAFPELYIPVLLYASPVAAALVSLERAQRETTNFQRFRIHCSFRDKATVDSASPTLKDLHCLQRKRRHNERSPGLS